MASLEPTLRRRVRPFVRMELLKIEGDNVALVRPPADERDQLWLEIPINDAWIAAFRVEWSGPPKSARRRARILELRVTPSERETTRPPKPFAFAALRRIVTERGFNAALAATVDNIAAQGKAAIFREPASGLDRRRGAGRPRKPDHFYARIAVRYSRIENDPDRDGAASTVARLADKHHVPITTVGKWLTTARKLGFLTPTARGQRGGRVTTLGLEQAKGKTS